MSKQEHWKDEPEDHDYDAAQEYMSLLTSDEDAEAVVKRLRDAPIRWFKAKDLLRASGLAALPEDNEHVKKDLDKIKCHEKLSPILLIRARPPHVPLTIADGYHRVCASYILDEDAEIPARFW